MGNQIAITNVVTISLAQGNVGIGNYNTSNLALFTTEQAQSSFGNLSYNAYVSPTQVGIDFGTSSVTYQMANAVFSQQPNILAGGGQLIVVLLTTAIQNLAFSGVAASGTFVFNYGGHASAAINWNDTTAQIQTKIRAISGLADAVVTGTIASESVNVQFYGVYGALSLATITSNSVETSGSSSITITVTTGTAGQQLGAAITAASSNFQFFGVMCNADCAAMTQADVLVTAAVVLPLNKIWFLVSNATADIAPGGTLDLLRTGTYTNSRGLYYGNTTDDLQDLLMQAAYAGLALSTNWNGSLTASTMHLKPLAGIQPDPTMTQTLLNEAVAAGADSYVSFQGDSAVYTSGLNGAFYDQIYGQQWFTGALQVAGFNFLAQSSTKIPQTEAGMSGLKSAYAQICQQAVTAGWAAPGTWNSASTFGNSANLISNVAQVGYYIYSTPIALQSQTVRVTRAAPLVQIALKLAGAIQSTSVLAIINP